MIFLPLKKFSARNAEDSSVIDISHCFNKSLWMKGCYQSKHCGINARTSCWLRSACTAPQILFPGLQSCSCSRRAVQFEKCIFLGVRGLFKQGRKEQLEEGKVTLCIPFTVWILIELLRSHSCKLDSSHTDSLLILFWPVHWQK